MFDLQLWDLFVGFMLALVLVNLFPKLALIGGWLIKIAKAAWTWVMSKISGSTPTIIAMFAMTLVMLMGFSCNDQVAKQQQSDAYICGEPPDEVTFYCRTGTGPPRQDCSAAQPGMYDKDPRIC